MRLINTETLEIHSFADRRSAPSYAILSHCWGNNEVSYKEYAKKQNTDGTGYKKIVECCSFAKARGKAWVWIDTCCIDKRSSAELSEAINSMYEWYRKADECYAYLIDVTAPPSDHTAIDSQLRASRWFRRGWTLQELLAPEAVLFVSSEWREIGYKEPLSGTESNPRQDHFSDLVADVTGIPRDVLKKTGRMYRYSAAQRLSWSALRETTRIEDAAYCLFGIFDIHMPLLYGEGHEAFSRLLHAILNRTGDESILARQGNVVNLFPHTPHAYRRLGKVRQIDAYGQSPITVSLRWAELGSSTRRSSVFYKRDQPHIRVVRLNCAHFDDHLSPSSCIVFLTLLPCGHFTSMPSEKFSSYLSNRDLLSDRPQKYPYCERDLAGLDQWVPLHAIKASLVHLTAQDANICQAQSKTEASSKTVQFLLNGSV